MNTFSNSQKKRVAGNIRKELEAKFPAHGRNRRLARLVGVSPATVSQWLKGTSSPELEHLWRMAVAFDVPLHRLCGYSMNRRIRTNDRLFDAVIALSMFNEWARRAEKKGGALKLEDALAAADKYLVGLE